MTNESAARRGRLWPALTLLSLTLNVGLAIWILAERDRASQRTYDRIVEETWMELQPAYRAAGIDAQKPSSFAELLRPWVSVVNYR